jgi:hypothetical protein
MNQKQNNIINCIFIAVAVVFVVHCLFKKIRTENMTDLNNVKKSVTFTDNSENSGDLDKNISESELQTKTKLKTRCPSFKFKDYDEPQIYSPVPKSTCPLPQNEKETGEYLTQFLLGRRPVCPTPIKSKKEFNNDFFNFRDLTHNNSSQRYDSVDKIQQMYLQGNLDEAHRNPNMKIKDLFDETTKGPNKYTRSCVRLPQFDNINNDGYQMSYGTHPMHLTRDNWTYSNEKTMNGAQMNNGLYGHDLSIGNNMPYKS